MAILARTRERCSVLDIEPHRRGDLFRHTHDRHRRCPSGNGTRAKRRSRYAAPMNPSPRITARTHLRYSEGADLALDRPAYVRAGSGMRLVQTRAGRRLLIAQDDANFFALVDPATMRTSSVTLPEGTGGGRLFGDSRGNKHNKLDLECVEVFLVDGREVVLAFGSGSLRPRECAVRARLDGPVPEVDVIDIGPLHTALRALPLLRGGALNLEGMCRVPCQGGARVRLFHRGNGAGGVDATIDVFESALLAFLWGTGDVPVLLDARMHTLGDVGGVRLSFTDACAGGGRLWVTAAAEASPNAIDDGVVVGCGLGVWNGARFDVRPIIDEHGQRWLGKPEGLALDDQDPHRAWIVVDQDDESAPAELLTLDV